MIETKSQKRTKFPLIDRENVCNIFWNFLDFLYFPHSLAICGASQFCGVLFIDFLHHHRCRLQSVFIFPFSFIHNYTIDKFYGLFECWTKLSSSSNLFNVIVYIQRQLNPNLYCVCFYYARKCPTKWEARLRQRGRAFIVKSLGLVDRRIK